MMKIRFFFIMAALCAFSAVQAQGEQPVTATEIVKSEGVAFVEGKTFAEKTQNLYGGEETITENIQELIEKMKTSHYSSSKLCLGYWLTVLLPDNLDLEKGENDIYTDSEFIAELVVNGFRVEEVSDN